MTFSANSKGGPGTRPGLSPFLFIMLLCPFTVTAATMGPAISLPDPDTVVLQMDDVAGVGADQASLSADDVAYQIRLHIERSRETGSPRPLGLAQGLMDKLPEQDWTADVYLMRATVLQRLHRFDEAEADLDRVLGEQPDNRQAWLTRYRIAMVRADLQTAGKACQQLTQLRQDLLAASCTQELASYGEQPVQAVERLRKAVQTTQSASPVERDYAWITLADMTTRLGMPDAESYWQRSLLMVPDDLYRRMRYADWLLGHERAAKAEEITRGYQHIDTLAVLRAIALKRLDHPDAAELEQVLELRFAEARWRGEFMHQWEYARFMLDVKDQPTAALTAACENWRTQRGDMDWQLLNRAAAAAGDTSCLPGPLADRGML